MTAKELLLSLQKKGIEIWSEGGQLRLRAAKGLITKQIQAVLIENKIELLSLLNSDCKPGRDDSQSLSNLIEHDELSPFPLSDVQAAYWMGRRDDFELGNVGAHVYLELEGSGLNLQRLNQSWQQLVQRHEMLRAVINSSGQQQILRDVPAYTIEQLSFITEPESLQQLEQTRQRMMQEVFNPERWPLFEIKWVEVPGDRHRVLFKYDALILDAQSQQLLFSEWEQLYRNPKYQLPELVFSFREFIQSELTQRSTPGYLRSKDYWQQRVEGFPLGPDLPLACSPASIEKPVFDKVSRRINRPSWSKLKQQASTYNLTPSGLLLSCFADVLKVWSKSPQFSINLTLFNRPNTHPQIENIVGDFSSLSMLEIDHDVTLNIVQRAQKLQQQLWQDLENMKFSGVEMQRELSRHHRQNITIPVVFTSVLHQHKEQQGPARRWLGEDSELYYPTPQVWLDYIVTEEEGELELQWNYVSGLFPSGMLESMLDASHDYLMHLVENPLNWHTDWLSTRQLISPDIWPEGLRNYNQTEKNLPLSNMLMHELFERQVRLRPQHIAVKSTNKLLSYQALDQHANAVANALVQRAVESNTLVAVVMNKGWEQVSAVVGILKAGAAYLPIDGDTPEKRIRELLEQGQVQTVLLQSELRQLIDWPDSIERIVVDELTPTDSSPDNCSTNPDDLAYVIFTSGSTGAPKGVEITHRSAVNTLLDINDRFKVDEHDRLLALSSLTFDLSVYDIFGSLAAGASIIIPAAEDSKNPGSWAHLIDQEKISLWNSVPQLMQLLIDFCKLNPQYSMQSLRLCLLSGDWIPVALPGQLSAFNKKANIIGLGGATEASIWSIYYPINDVDDEWDSIPYGRPLANQQFYVLDEMLEVSPPWVTGELYIAGLGLSTGYWRDELKTDERYLSHPETGKRLYRTGDKGRYHPDGYIEFLGRTDSQLKIRGHRIEPGEIEAQLTQHPDVSQAIVVAQGRKHYSQLIAYLVPEGDEPACNDLRRFLQQRLPAYMIPESFVALDLLPLSGNGKVDHRALPTADLTQRNLDNEFRASVTDLEKLLEKIWQEVLGIKGPIGVQDNFFELGGNSIDAAVVINRLQELLGGIFHLVAIFKHPSISELQDFLTTEYPEYLGLSDSRAEQSASEIPIGVEDINLLKGKIRKPAVASHLAQKKNPPAIFILSPPRSGSTLLRVMMQGHPGLFAPPELFLLPYNSLQEQMSDFTGHRKSTLESNVRALMAIHQCSFREAEVIRFQLEKANSSVQDYYRYMQRKLGDKLLVDKTPSYSLNYETLLRAEDLFENALYIHLTRHPYGMIRSFEESRMEHDWFPYITGDNHYLDNCKHSRRQLAEMVWNIAHKNILQFTQQLPRHRHICIGYEQLLLKPQDTLTDVCKFLGLDFDVRMLTPYDDSYHRMTDGINNASRMQGDMKFLKHRGLNLNTAEQWKSAYNVDFLSSSSFELARELGYHEKINKQTGREVGEF